MKSFSPVILLSVLVCLLSSPFVSAQTQPANASSGLELYRALKGFQLSGGTATVQKLVLKRDRVEMTFDGLFYFEAPIAGRVYGAVFVGSGTIHAEPPPAVYERENLRRLLKADVVESDFRSAVLRFTDDTFEVIGKNLSATGTPTPEVQKLAAEFEPRWLKEIGANVSARLAVSLLNGEAPGVFVAQFDGGRRRRFALVLDEQGRIPSESFGINGGEKGLFFARRFENNFDVWMAFYSLRDYERGRVEYSDVYDVAAIPHYNMQVDLSAPEKTMKLAARLEVETLGKSVTAIPLAVNEDLGEEWKERLKKSLRLKSARLAGGAALDAVQEDWETGLTLFLPAAKNADDRFAVEMEFEGDFLYDASSSLGSYFPLSYTSWYPRSGFLRRSTFDVTFRHSSKMSVACSGMLVREETDPADKNIKISQFRVVNPLPFAAFALGPFERYAGKVTWKDGGELPVEYYAPTWRFQPTFHDFMLAELTNTIQYFSNLFGKYPFSNLRATFHRFAVGLGYPTMLLLPQVYDADRGTYSFIAHEVAHQWWGGVVAWRSYRDQWLSEGFAEYSGALYTGRRDKPYSRQQLISEMRRSLKALAMPASASVPGNLRLVDVGPIILGHRLSTRETRGAYTALIYDKGALVLRMLHFLFTDPETGNDDAFFAMMTDFVKRHANRYASTEDFIKVANEHFVRTPVAQSLKLKDLNWFFREWVYQSYLPSYRMDYTMETQPDGTFLMNGTIFQDKLPETEKWFMPLPLTIHFGKNKITHSVVYAFGPKASFVLKFRERPERIELDPDEWVLSEKTSSK